MRFFDARDVYIIRTALAFTRELCAIPWWAPPLRADQWELWELRAKIFSRKESPRSSEGGNR